MGRKFLDHPGGSRIYSCANCETPLTNRGELVSTVSVTMARPTNLLSLFCLCGVFVVFSDSQELQEGHFCSTKCELYVFVLTNECCVCVCRVNLCFSETENRIMVSAPTDNST